MIVFVIIFCSPFRVFNVFQVQQALDSLKSTHPNAQYVTLLCRLHELMKNIHNDEATIKDDQMAATKSLVALEKKMELVRKGDTESAMGSGAPSKTNYKALQDLKNFHVAAKAQFVALQAVLHQEPPDTGSFSPPIDLQLDANFEVL